MKKFTCSLLSIALATALTACGGGSDGKKSSSSTTPTVNQNKPDTQQKTAIGRFVDAAVEGVEVFQNGKSLGKTNKMGQFEYMVNGGLLTFKIGQVTLGSTQPKPIVTPVDLTTDVNEQTEIMQVLQSLDSDQNPENGINISETVINNLDTPMNLTDKEVTPLDVIQKAIPGSHHVVPADAARAHFEKTMKEDASTNHNNGSSKADKMVGYWKSDCITTLSSSAIEKDYNSKIIYIEINLKDNQLIMPNIFHFYFNNNNCSNTHGFTLSEGSKYPVKSSVIESINLENENNLILNTNLNSKNVTAKGNYSRLNKNEYLEETRKYDPRNKDPQSLAYKLKGNWVSRCTDYYEGSQHTYASISPLDNNRIEVESRTWSFPDSKKCNGDYLPDEPKKIIYDLNDSNRKFTLYSDDKYFTMEYQENGQTKKIDYKRIKSRT